MYDPRLQFPPPALPEDTPSGSQQEHIVPCAELASSGLWDANIRDNVLEPSYSKSDLDRRRHELSLPGTRLRPLTQDDRIPLLLVAAGNAYTIIYPRGWSQPILHSVVYSSILLGGLEERRAAFREAGVPSFPEHYGNTCKAGRDWEISIATEDERRWKRKPPGRRLGDPIWKADWDKIFRGSEEEAMNSTDGTASDIWALPPSLIDYTDRAEGAIKAFRKQRGMADRETRGHAVVHVKLETEGRGSPGRMAEIYALGKQERADWIVAVDKGSDRVNEDVPPALKVGIERVV